VLAVVANGATLISNDRLYVWPTSSQATVVGWTDPIRVIGASPAVPKRMIPLIQHAHSDRSQVAEQPLPLAEVIVPDVRPGPFTLACVEFDKTTGNAAARAEVLPQRVRWLGLEPDPRLPVAAPTAAHPLRLSGRPPGRHDASRHAAIAILKLREDLLRRGAHATKSAVTENQHGTSRCLVRDRSSSQPPIFRLRTEADDVYPEAARGTPLCPQPCVTAQSSHRVAS
jgi:hypothetical protein